VRKTNRIAAYVAPIESSEGIAKWANHAPSGGSRLPKSTRLAGFEIGNTKLAAFATNAHA
jgi:hypothetical protein